MVTHVRSPKLGSRFTGEEEGEVHGGESLSRTEMRTLGVRGAPYLFDRMGAEHFEPGSREETQTYQSFTQVQAASLRNTLRPACLVLLKWWRFTKETVLPCSALSVSLSLA